MTTTARFGVRLTQLKNTLPSPAVSAPQPAASSSVEPAHTRAAAARLTVLLSEFDPGAVEFIEANHAALRVLFPGDAWPQFEKLVQDYAFPEAQTQVELALKTRDDPAPGALSPITIAPEG